MNEYDGHSLRTIDGPAVTHYEPGAAGLPLATCLRTSTSDEVCYAIVLLDLLASDRRH